jgi:hypothetical protein
MDSLEKLRLDLPPVKELLAGCYSPEMQAAFPDVDPGLVPFGYLILMQIRTPRSKIGSIIVTDISRDDEKWRVQTGLVRALGPSAFKRRDDLKPWPEGDWCKPGDFVRCPIYGGDRWVVPIPGGKADDNAIFLIVKDTDLIGRVTTDPMKIITS